ncbi:cytochrome-c oxidase [Paenibacillus sp. V4I5]|uniref:cytochrome-c oxidase n=1 Tax=Paenibacillus sp. V4I5 TaxID=3042306 RepID=UPI00278DCC30|nr:cytochrome-c oxidase [Paenibacillus sp. V4I5]MDQ0914906.1 cbb3-type cytochrome oxidase subunit 1 [Paenibacillus sp. V4I5]
MGIMMFRISVVYFFIGVVLGILIHVMPEQAVVHPHWNLLGWVSFALGGIVYCLFPKAGTSKLGKAHFWLHLLGIPILLYGLLRVGMGQPAEPFAPLGGLLYCSRCVVIMV